jgi:hypothetical protein
VQGVNLFAVLSGLAHQSHPKRTLVPSSGFLKQVSFGATRRINHLQTDKVVPIGLYCSQSELNGQPIGQLSQTCTSNELRSHSSPCGIMARIVIDAI